MSMVTVRSLGALRLGRLALSALRSNDGAKTGRGIDVRNDVMRVAVTSDRPFPYQLDGDHLGDVTSLEFVWEPDQLQLVVPDGRIIPRPTNIL